MTEEKKTTRMLPVNEVAERLGCSRATVLRRIADGTLPAVKLGRLVRVREDVLERMLDEAAAIPAKVVGGG